jgi:NADPH:quinone reductase-like Zn-dependent oxidoreductase
MKAMQYQAYGTPDQLKLAEAPAPRPAPLQLLVRVAATSVNPVDWKLHTGQYRLIMPVRFPSIPGFDIAGEVVEVGSRVTRFGVGDRIFAMLNTRRVRGGAAAEYAVVDESAAARAPANLPAQEAAAIPLAGLAALQGLRDLGEIAAGQHVLIVGASGGVGHFAVQIAKHFGATVTAVASDRRAGMLRALGADRVIDYSQHGNWSGRLPYDLVFDVIARRPVQSYFPWMTSRGVYVSSLPSFGRVAAAILLPLFSRRRVRILGVHARGADLDQLRVLCESGRLRPVIDRVFPLAELAAAHAYSQQGHTAGKIVVTV